LLDAWGHADHAWQEEKNRSEFMERMALRESLSFALDVNDYRDFLGLYAELITDESLSDLCTKLGATQSLFRMRQEEKAWYG